MQEKKYFKIVSTDYKEKKIQASIKLDPLHDMFKGHFPNHPVLPGVCILQMVKEVINAVFDKSFFMQRVDAIKFLQMVNPEQHEKLLFNLNIDTQKEVITANILGIFTNDVPFVKCKATYSID